MKRIALVKVPAFAFPSEGDKNDIESSDDNLLRSGDYVDEGNARLGTPHQDREDSDFRKKNIEEFTPSLALAILSGFIKKFFKARYVSMVNDMNLKAWESKRENGAVQMDILDEAVEEVIKFNPDVLAVSCQFQIHQRWVDELVVAIKRKCPNARVITGGGFASVFPEEALSKEGVDYVVIGEGEHTFVHILHKIFGIEDEVFSEEWPFDGYGEKGVDGSVRTVDKTQFLSDLGRLAIPDWNIPGLADHFREYPETKLPFMATRGCPMQCSFCNTDLQWGQRVRARPAEKIIEELTHAIETLGVTDFHCVDDNILVPRKWAFDFFEKVSEAMPEGVKFHFSNFDMRFLRDDVLDALKKLGVEQVTIATETGSESTQRKISKYLKLDRVREVVQRLHKKGFIIHNCLILGFPGESFDDMMETVTFAKELRTESIQIHPLQPYRGTKAYEEAVALGVIDQMFEDDYESRQWHTSKVSGEDWDAETCEKLAYDTAIELNFLSTPLWDTKKGRTILSKKMDRLNDVLPGHVIAYICRGYLEKLSTGERDSELYALAQESLRSPEGQLFEEYLGYEYDPISDFNDWRMGQQIALTG